LAIAASALQLSADLRPSTLILGRLALCLVSKLSGHITQYLQRSKVKGLYLRWRQPAINHREFNSL
jgi:hypothetical protein